MEIKCVRFRDETRPATVQITVDGSVRYPALVHVTKVGAHGMYVCELESGDVIEVRPEYVHFLDSRDRFGEVCWFDGGTTMEELERFDGSDPHYRCKVCGHENYEDHVPRYCPNCGFNVVSA